MGTMRVVRRVKSFMAIVNTVEPMYCSNDKHFEWVPNIECCTASQLSTSFGTTAALRDGTPRLLHGPRASSGIVYPRAEESTSCKHCGPVDFAIVRTTTFSSQSSNIERTP